ncbi:14986_t:CDS:1, partial [Gigaspora rosea]
MGAQLLQKKTIMYKLKASIKRPLDEFEHATEANNWIENCRLKIAS